MGWGWGQSDGDGVGMGIESCPCAALVCRQRNADIPELCTAILQIMRSRFADYVHNILAL